MRQPLTERQREVYDYLVEHIAAEGFAPTIHQVAEHFGWASDNAAHIHLVALREKGWVKKTRGYYPISKPDVQRHLLET